MVKGLQGIVRYCPDYVKDVLGRHWVSKRENGFPELNKRRTVATVAKMLVDQGEEQAAGVLVQMFGSGEPYEECDE